MTPPKCSSYKVFCHVLNKCSKKPVSNVIKNTKTSRQPIHGVQIGSNTKFAYQPKAPRIPKETNDKNDITIPSTSNSFDVLSSIVDVKDGEDWLSDYVIHDNPCFSPYIV